MEFDKVIRKRFSTRKFSDKEIEQEKLDAILEAGRIAPTAKNNQPFKIYVVKSKLGLADIDLATRCRYNAKIVLLICGDQKKAYTDDKGSTYEMDVSIVATHMMLKATDIGIDNIWVRLFDSNILKEKFNIPDNLVPVCLLMLGYKDEECVASKMHEIRKELDELVEYK